MTPDQFLKLLRHEPFFTLHIQLSSGEVVLISDPESVILDGTTVQVFSIQRDGPHTVDVNRYIPLRSIAQIVQTTIA